MVDKILKTFTHKKNTYFHIPTKDFRNSKGIRKKERDDDFFLSIWKHHQFQLQRIKLKYHWIPT